MDRYLDYEQAAAFLSIKRGTLYSLVCRKRIPHTRLGGRLVRFSLDELHRWLTDGKVPVEVAPPAAEARPDSADTTAGIETRGVAPMCDANIRRKKRPPKEKGEIAV